MERRGDGMSASQGSAGEITIPSDDQKFAVCPAERGREMHCVVSTEALFLCEPASLACEGFVDADQRHGERRVVEIGDGSAQVAPVDPSRALGCRERGSCLGVDEVACDPQVRGAPQLVGEVRAVLGHDELHDRGGVEIGVQRRWSATRSATGSAALARPRARGRQRLVGSETSPRARRSASGSE